MSAACHFLRQSLHKNAVTAKVEWRIKRRDHAESQRPGHRSQFMNLDLSVARSPRGSTDSHDLSFTSMACKATRRARSGNRASESLRINSLFEPSQRPDRAIVEKREQLHHVDATDVFDVIDPEFGIEDAGPAHAARAAEAFRRGIVCRDLKSETELVLAGAERERLRPLRVGIRLQVEDDRADRVLGHQLY